MSALFLATNNRHKIEELRVLLRELGVELRSAADLQGASPPHEDGATFEANAQLKALHYAALTGIPALADDSGLEVTALGGRPGVRSARYAGARASDRDNRQKLLAEMHAVPDGKRTARFRCVIAVAHRAAIALQASGSVDGQILLAERGSGGFGYDALFYHPPLDKTFAELTPEEKNSVSHRARALQELLPQLRGFLK